ncbi:ABC transporter ATP-binding protein [Stutzerimonas kirkiae]|uniref:Histidinol phosphatase n=1 Tax=Stutzerimonas kirkiae TaxID=2211392 RepID=A0A4Q9RC07_9GAMM|nr:ABC transporter ATP-binding protein [Stutzerimonas kirkiae]TBU98569.1 histidinol phosphatase [Stutzerimonas kirkiae]TBV04257.1 histidinol phosphatase [Stutzerimonas kirkiae]TBV10960.1 histidinol phosphatase [Stutzerimonas kirkiae]TBV14320.1 histidinol phosphatase [Stutzerimonas kirkiae]
MASLLIRGLGWRASDGARPWLLRGVDLEVGEGEFVGLIGPNGSGKTSLLRCAYRFNRPDEGSVSLDGSDLWRQSPRWSARRIAVVLQEFPQEFGLSVEALVAMGRTPHKGLFEGDDREDGERVSQALERVGMAHARLRPFAPLSGGEKQRVLLARALAQQPGLLILDEPTNHLDPRYQLELLQLLRKLRLSTLASFHDLNLAAAFCDRLYVIDGGRILASGTPHEVLSAERLQQVFGVHALVDRHPLADHPRITWVSSP